MGARRPTTGPSAVLAGHRLRAVPSPDHVRKQARLPFQRIQLPRTEYSLRRAQEFSADRFRLDEHGRRVPVDEHLEEPLGPWTEIDNLPFPAARPRRGRRTVSPPARPSAPRAGGGTKERDRTGICSSRRTRLPVQGPAESARSVSGRPGGAASAHHPPALRTAAPPIGPGEHGDLIGPSQCLGEAIGLDLPATDRVRGKMTCDQRDTHRPSERAEEIQVRLDRFPGLELRGDERPAPGADRGAQ